MHYDLKYKDIPSHINDYSNFVFHRGYRLISTVELEACIEIFRKHATSSGQSTKLNKAAFATLIPTKNVNKLKLRDYLLTMSQLELKNMC